MGMNPTLLLLLVDGVIRRVALSSGHPPAPRLIGLLVDSRSGHSAWYALEHGSMERHGSAHLIGSPFQ